MIIATTTRAWKAILLFLVVGIWLGKPDRPVVAAFLCDDSSRIAAQHRRQRVVVHDTTRSTRRLRAAKAQNYQPVTEDCNDIRSKTSSRRRFVEQGAAAAAIATTSTLLPSRPIHALTAQQAAQDYDTYAASYDGLDGGAAASVLGLDAARQALLAPAVGHVLEIGVGTGLNLAYYDLTRIQSLTLVDISPGMLVECQSKWKNLQEQSSSTPFPPVHFVTADATTELVEHFGKDRFDTVVDTFSLCVMGNQGAAKCLSQLSQVLRPSGGIGTLRLLENTRSDQGVLGWYQDVTAQAAATVGGKGCVYNQNVQSMMKNTEPPLRIIQETSYASGLFRAFVAQRIE